MLGLIVVLMIVSLIGNVFFFTRNRALMKFIKESEAHFKKAKKDFAKIQHQQDKSTKQLSERQEKIQILEKALETQKSKLKSSENEWSEAKAHWMEELRHEKSQLAIAREQMDVLTSKMKELDSELFQAKKDKKQRDSDVSELEGKVERKYQQELSELKSELRKAQSELKNLKNQNDKNLELLKSFGPKKVASLKKRINSGELLIQSMKGQKEMAEERADNMMVAAQKLALHILSEKADQKDRPLESIKAALKKIHVELVDDEHADPASSSKVTKSSPKNQEGINTEFGQ